MNKKLHLHCVRLRHIYYEQLPYERVGFHTHVLSQLWRTMLHQITTYHTSQGKQLELLILFLSCGASFILKSVITPFEEKTKWSAFWVVIYIVWMGNVVDTKDPRVREVYVKGREPTRSVRYTHTNNSKYTRKAHKNQTQPCRIMRETNTHHSIFIKAAEITSQGTLIEWGPSDGNSNVLH